MLVHAAFAIFVIAGGALVIRWPRIAWLHLPSAVWGVAIELTGGVCPLTYVEVRWRRLGGQAGYDVAFIQQYLEPILYPVGIAPEQQKLLGLMALLVNLVFYALMWRRHRGKS